MSMGSRLRSCALRLLAVAVVGAAALPAPSGAEGHGAYLSWGILDDAPEGYLGCVATVSLPTKYWCFVAYQVPEGPDQGMVSVTAHYGDQETWPLVHQVRAAVPGDALVVGGPPTNITMTFRATLPGIGAVDVSHRSWEIYSHTSINEGCVLHPIHHEVRARDQQRVLRGVSWSSGQVAGAAVEGHADICNIYFWGPVSGLWRMGMAFGP